MGDRGNIAIQYCDDKTIYFYSHWLGTELRQILANALARGAERWEDESYLARIIFSEMIQDDIKSVTGFGIAPYEVDPEHKTIVVNPREQTIECDDSVFTFEEFIEYVNVKENRKEVVS